jgi:hypothetical protein
MENPRMKRFRVELRLTNCRLDNPTAVIIPNMTQKMPPTIGSVKKIVEEKCNKLKHLNTVIYFEQFMK